MNNEYNGLLEQIPLCIWIEDLSEVKKYLNKLQDKGIEDLKQYLEQNPHQIKHCISLIRIIDMNQNILRKYGIQENELKDIDLNVIFTETTYRDHIDQIIAIAKNKLTYSTETENRNIHGENFYVQMKWVAEDTSYSKVMITIQDITKRKKYENALLASEKRFRKISLYANDAIIMIDNRGKVNFWNKAAEKIFGYRKAEITGKDLHKLVTPPESYGRFQENFHEFVNSGKGPLIGKTVELIARRKNGELFPIEISITSLRFDNEWFGLSIIRDITNRKKYEKDLKRHKEQLALVNRILRHDLTNNLASIRSLLQLFQETKNEKVFEKTIDYVDKSSDLIAKMREHESLITSDNLSVYDTGRIYDYIKKNYSSLEINVRGNMEIFADESIYSVFDNLVNNAIVHGKTNRIDLNATTKNDLCEIAVKDYGKGIEGDLKPKIFDKGFTTKQKQHSGLGLHIVDAAIDRWGGFIMVEDNKPRGAIFKLYLNKVR